MVELPLLPSCMLPTDKSTIMLMATMLTESFVSIPKVAMSQNSVICYRHPSVKRLCDAMMMMIVINVLL